MLALYDFDAAARDYAKVTLYSDQELGRLLDTVRQSPERWCVDFDPMWREVIVFCGPDDPSARERLAALVEAVGSERSVTHASPLAVESPQQLARGVARRQFRRAGVSHTAEVQAEVRPLPPGSGVQVVAADALFSSVLTHGVRRAARFGPSGRYPVGDAHIEVTFTTTPEAAPALADLHAAATQATTRALQAAACSLRVALDPGVAPAQAPPTFPELENSVAETYLNILALLDYPVDEVSDEDRSHLGAFIAYQLSLLFGHSVDEKMRRQPASPPAPVRAGLGALADTLLQRCAQETAPGGEMVGDLLRMWVADWHVAAGAATPAVAAPETQVDEAEGEEPPAEAPSAEAPPAAPAPAEGGDAPPLPSPAAPAAYAFDDDDEDDGGC